MLRKLILRAIRPFVLQVLAERDPLGEFLRQCTRRDPDAAVGAHDLYLVYARWSHGQGAWPMAEFTFAANMAGEGYRCSTTRIRTYPGLSLRRGFSSRLSGEPQSSAVVSSR